MMSINERLSKSSGAPGIPGKFGEKQAMRRIPFAMQSTTVEKILLTGQDAVHLRDVLRAQIGDSVILFNGAGEEYEAVIRDMDRESVSLEIIERRDGIAPSPLFLSMGIALLKENKVDDMIRPLTELGVRRIHVFKARRSIPAPDAGKIVKMLARWSRLAVEAMKQCGVNEAPEIFFHKSLSDLLEAGRREETSNRKSRKIFFWENTKASEWPEPGGGMDHIHAVFGPEGGFAEEEIEVLLREAFLPLGLGPRILRAPTAVLAGAALLQYQYGDLSLPPVGFHPESSGKPETGIEKIPRPRA